MMLVRVVRWLRGRANGWLVLSGGILFLLLQGELLAATVTGSDGRPKRAEVEHTPVLGEQIEIEDPSGSALDHFHDALARAERHQGQARIVVWGASHTAGDEYAGLLRRDLQERFGHMLEAFEFGTPPHGGIAPGIDRICMILADEPNIREVIAFPKNQAARDVMGDAPSPVEPKQLKELHIQVEMPPEL